MPELFVPYLLDLGIVDGSPDEDLMTAVGDPREEVSPDGQFIWFHLPVIPASYRSSAVSVKRNII